MKLLNRFDVTRDSGGPRKFTFEMTMFGLASLGIVVVLGLCWVFILGILVGRGYKPEAAVPQLAQIMPTTEAPKAQEQPDDNKPPTVLKAEDLQFMDGIQGKGGDTDVVVDSTQGKKSPAEARKPQPKVNEGHDLADAKRPQAAPLPQPKPAEGRDPLERSPQAMFPAPAPQGKPKAADPRDLAAKSSAKDEKKPEKAKIETKIETKAPEQKVGRYEAVYQVASFFTKEQAETMVKKLAGKGVTASVREAKSGTKDVYRVTVQARGTDQEIGEAVKRTGEKGPILLEKKPL